MVSYYEAAPVYEVTPNPNYRPSPALLCVEPVATGMRLIVIRELSNGEQHEASDVTVPFVVWNQHKALLLEGTRHLSGPAVV
jgi:hypothetical protein